MTNRNNSINIPEAREAMDKFKMSSANEVGVNLNQGRGGDPTFERENRVVNGHKTTVKYIADLQFELKVTTIPNGFSIYLKRKTPPVRFGQ